MTAGELCIYTLITLNLYIPVVKVSETLDGAAANIGATVLIVNVISVEGLE